MPRPVAPLGAFAHLQAPIAPVAPPSRRKVIEENRDTWRELDRVLAEESAARPRGPIDEPDQ
jgi:hypothetical protein